MAILTKNRFRTSHWYTREGLPMHNIMKADGSGERSATLKDARRLGLLPSVTGIISILEKPALETWKLNQVALASLRCPRDPAESDDYWCTRVRDTAFDQVDRAADIGSTIHDALECATAGEAWDAETLGVFVRPVLAMIELEQLEAVEREKTLVSLPHGFAGTADLLFRSGGGGRGIIDYKTKRTKPGEKVVAYDEHRMQLAAYAACYYGEERLPDVRAVNVFISTTEPGRCDIIRHGDLTPDWEAFKLCASLWRYLKGYDPRSAG